jgi:glycosyltransferase involved in cell wall biosynthesis
MTAIWPPGSRFGAPQPLSGVSATSPGSGFSIVVPTLGRPSLSVLLEALAAQVAGHTDLEVLVVDDRRTKPEPLDLPHTLGPYVRVLAGRAAGPAAARNAGWRAARHEWVAFLDDDVVPEPDWLAALGADLAAAAPDVGGSQGRIWVPATPGRRPTDWERVTAALADGKWITADMAYRRSALAEVGGFDERFPRAFREDAEIAARVRAAGWRLGSGRRTVTHPVRPESPWVSVRTQAGNADDALLRRLYGPSWRQRLDIPPGRRRRHAAVSAAGAAALVGAVLGIRRSAGFAAAAWLAGTAEFAWTRIAPGPRTPREVATMAVTSAAIPPTACAYWLLGWWRARRVGRSC